MARGNKYICATCGKEFEYCPKCAITKPSYDAERYCSKDHAEIFAILSQHGCHLATDKETLKALSNYDTTSLSEGVQAHIKSLQPAAEVKPAEKAEGTKEVETTFKKNKFRTQE